MVVERPLIVVVDDDQAIRELLFDLLTDEGYHTIASHDSVDALEIIQRMHPDLIITDLWMDERFAGFTLLQALRQDPSLAHIPVILCAANQRFLRENADRLEGLSCVSVEKPFDLSTILSVVEQCLADHGQANRSPLREGEQLQD